MLVYGIINLASEEVIVNAITDIDIDDRFLILGWRCHEAELPFCYNLSSSSLVWWSPADECTYDYDDIFYLDDDGDAHFLKDEYFLSDEPYHKIIINAYDAFVERLKGVIPYLR